MIPSYSPRARGREERSSRTWQGHLPQELRLRSITTVEAANEFLRTHYIAEINGRLRSPAARERKRLIRSTRKDLDWVFSIQHERTVNPDNTVVVDNRVLQIQKTKWRNTLAGCTVIVHELRDGAVAVRYGPHEVARWAAHALPAPSRPIRRQPPRGWA